MNNFEIPKVPQSTLNTYHAIHNALVDVGALIRALGPDPKSAPYLQLVVAVGGLEAALRAMGRFIELVEAEAAP